VLEEEAPIRSGLFVSITFCCVLCVSTKCLLYLSRWYSTVSDHYYTQEESKKHHDMNTADQQLTVSVTIGRPTALCAPDIDIGLIVCIDTYT